MEMQSLYFQHGMHMGLPIHGCVGESPYGQAIHIRSARNRIVKPGAVALCGIDNDPWRKHFNLGKYYYFWAEFYLCLGAMTCTYFTYGLAKLFCSSAFEKNSKVATEKPKTD